VDLGTSKSVEGNIHVNSKLLTEGVVDHHVLGDIRRYISVELRQKQNGDENPSDNAE